MAFQYLYDFIIFVQIEKFADGKEHNRSHNKLQGQDKPRAHRQVFQEPYRQGYGSGHGIGWGNVAQLHPRTIAQHTAGVVGIEEIAYDADEYIYHKHRHDSYESTNE